MKHILFDSDLLGDDLMALYAMVYDSAEIVGVTSYGRRTSSLDRCRIAQVFLEDHGAVGVPLVAGSNAPLLQAPLVGCTFCDDAMQDMKMRWSPTKRYANPILSHFHAAQFLVEKSKERKNLSLLCTGPLTNVALAILLDPGFPDRLGEVVMMGGVHGRRGNSSPVAEANIYNDPEAAKIVFSHCQDIVVVPLDVTLQVAVDDPMAARCRDPFIRDVALACCRAHVCKGGASLMPLHDLLAYLVLADSGYVTVERHSVDVETGCGPARGMMVLGDATERNQHRIAVGVDREKVFNTFDCLFTRS